MGSSSHLLNPKTAVFFAAFLPQFMDPALPAIPQGFVLGALFVGIAGITDTAYALTASTVAPVLARPGACVRPGVIYPVGRSSDSAC